MLNWIRSHLGAVLATTYLAVFMATVVLCLRTLIYYTASSEFSALLEIVATLPWSMLILPLCDVLGIMKWHDSFAASPVIYGLTGTLILLPGALINAFLCYLIGSRLVPRTRFGSRLGIESDL